MAYQEIQIGDTGQDARDKLDNNFTELYAAAVGEFLDNVFTLISNTSAYELTYSLTNLSTNQVLTVPDMSGLMAVAGMYNSFSFGGQAHSGSYQATWSSGVTFNANNGNIQEVVATNAGAIAMSNDLPGTYIYYVEIDTASSPSITIDASLGTELTNSTVAFDNSDNAINIITVVKLNSGTKIYTISN